LDFQDTALELELFTVFHSRRTFIIQWIDIFGVFQTRQAPDVNYVFVNGLWLGFFDSFNDLDFFFPPLFRSFEINSFDFPLRQDWLW